MKIQRPKNKTKASTFLHPTEDLFQTTSEGTVAGNIEIKKKDEHGKNSVTFSFLDICLAVISSILIRQTH